MWRHNQNKGNISSGKYENFCVTSVYRSCLISQSNMNEYNPQMAEYFRSHRLLLSSF